MWIECLFTLAHAMPIDLEGQPGLSRGQWSHVVPLELPPAPLTPELALAWSSGAGAGPLGVGWQLTGLQRIERKGSTGGPPDDSSTDRFWLDGQELHQTSGPGQAGWRVEVDDQRILTPSLTAGSNHWVAQRDGWTWWYGEFADGAGYAGSCATETPLKFWPCDDHPGEALQSSYGTTAWLLSRVEDPHGNVIDLTYTGRAGFDVGSPEDWLVGSRAALVPSVIRYGNDQREIRFEWSARSDVRSAFRGGTAWFESARLDEIEVAALSGGSYPALDHWRLEYLDEDAEPATGDPVPCAGESLPTVDIPASYLHRIVHEAEGGGERTERCMEVELAQDGFASTPLAVPVVPTGTPGLRYFPIATDWEGDGETELDGIWFDAGGTVTACLDSVLCGLPTHTLEEGAFIIGDLDGDGVSEAIGVDRIATTAHTWHRRYRRGGVLVDEVYPTVDTDPEFTLDPEELAASSLVDLDGDGTVELVDGSGYFPNRRTAPHFIAADRLDLSGDPGWWEVVLNDWLAGLVFDPEVAPYQLTARDGAIVNTEADVVSAFSWTDFNHDGIADFSFLVQGGDLEYVYGSIEDPEGPEFHAYSHAWLGDGTGGFVIAPWCVDDDQCVGDILADPLEPDRTLLLMGDLDRSGHPSRSGDGSSGPSLTFDTWHGEILGFGGESLTSPLDYVDDRFLCYEDPAESYRRARMFFDYNADGFSDLYEVEQHEGSGVRSDRWWRNERTVPRGKVRRIHLATGGSLAFEYGVSTGNYGSPELPVVLDVVTGVDTANGHTDLAYFGGTWHDADFLLPAGNRWFFDDEPPYFNPERRTCEVEVGPGQLSGGTVSQSVTASSLAQLCAEAGVPTDFAGRSFAIVLGWDRWIPDSGPLQALADRAWLPDGQTNADFPDLTTPDAAAWSPHDIPVVAAEFAGAESAPPPAVAAPATPGAPTPVGGETTEFRMELTLFEYDSDNRLTVVSSKRNPATAADDRRRDFSYEPWSSISGGKEVAQLKECDTSGTCRATAYADFASFGRAQTVTETGTGPTGALTRTTTYAYDHGMVVAVGHPDGATESFVRNDCGLVTSGTDGEGRVESRQYDLRCRETRRAWEGLVVETALDSFGRVSTRTTTPMDGGTIPTVTERYLYDDVVDDPDDRDDWNEPRLAVLRTGGTSSELDDRLTLTWLDPWGREALVARCANAGGDSSASDSTVLQEVGCDPAEPTVYQARTWGKDGTPRSASVGYGPGEANVASTWTYFDATGDLVTKLEPAPGATTPSWTTSTRTRTPGDLTVTDPMGASCTEAWNTTSWSRSCSGVSRGTRTIDAWGQATAVRNGEGEGYDDTFDSFGHRSSRILSDILATTDGAVAPTWSWEWDSQHRLAAEVDPHGSEIAWAYDRVGRPLTRSFTPGALAGPNATLDTWTYEDWSGLPLSRQVHRQDVNGGWRWTWLTGRGDPVQEFHPDGALTAIAWNGFGDVEGVTDRNAITHSFEYDRLGRRTASVEAGIWRSEASWTTSGELDGTVDPEGVETWYDRYWNGQIEAVLRPYTFASSSGTWELGSWSYRPDGQVSTELVGGLAREYGYDGLGRVTDRWSGGVATAWLRSEHWTYDDADRRATYVLDAAEDNLLPATTTWSYNAAGWVTGVQDALGSWSTWTYDRAGNVRAATDRDSYSSTWKYDALGRVVEEKLSGQGIRTFGYLFGTADGERHQVTEPDLGVWSTWYDGVGRPWKAGRPDGTGAESFYTGDQLTSVVELDSGGLPVSFEAWGYDERQRLVWEWGAAEGGYVSGTAPALGDYAFHWDYVDDVAGDGAYDVTRTAPDNEVTRWRLESGVVTSEEVSTPAASPRTQQVYVYDGTIPRVTGAGFGDGVNPTRATTFAYDALGRAVSVTNTVGADEIVAVYEAFDPWGTPGLAERWSNGALESRYVQQTNALGRLVGVAVQHDTSWSAWATWGYTDAGRPLSTQTSFAGGYEYAYDPATQAIAEVWSAGGTTLYAEITDRDGLGRPTRALTGSSGEIDWTWSQLGRIESWSATDGVTTETRAWYYDARGRPELVEHSGTGAFWQESRAYEEPGWLVSETRSDGLNQVYEERLYGYDAGGNREVTWKDGVQTSSAAYDGSFLSAVDGIGVTWDKDAVVADAAGTVVDVAADGAEAGVASATATYTFGRDPWGRPVWTDDGASPRRQLWGNPGGAWPLAGLDEAGDTKLTVAVEGVLLGELTNGTFTSGASDPAGNVVYLGSEWLTAPDAFGAEVTALTTSSFRHVFGGLEQLPDTGYQLAQHRLYDSGVGRFTRMDPLGLDGGAHRFMYADNDPTTRWDPAGLASSGCGQATLTRPDGILAYPPAEKIYTNHSFELVLTESEFDFHVEDGWSQVERRTTLGTGGRGLVPLTLPSSESLPGGPSLGEGDLVRRMVGLGELGFALRVAPEPTGGDESGGGVPTNPTKTGDTPPVNPDGRPPTTDPPPEPGEVVMGSWRIVGDRSTTGYRPPATVELMQKMAWAKATDLARQLEALPDHAATAPERAFATFVRSPYANCSSTWSACLTSLDWATNNLKEGYLTYDPLSSTLAAIPEVASQAAALPGFDSSDPEEREAAAEAIVTIGALIGEKLLDKFKVTKLLPDLPGPGVTGASGGGSGARFIGEPPPNGKLVDTHSTPRGSYDQPGGGRSDVLQREDHGAGLSHTHDPKVNTNPRTGQSFVNGVEQPGRPVSPEDVAAIESGLATPSSPRGR